MGESATAAAAPQHLRALQHANSIRLKRAELKRRIGAGQLAVADVVASMPAEVERMPVSELLMSQRRWGHARCRRLLVSLGVQENKPLGTFTDRQLEVLRARLEGKPPPAAHREVVDRRLAMAV